MSYRTKFPKVIQLLLLVLCCCAFTNDDEKDRIIISVNTPAGIGYFTDGNGNFLFNRQFEYVGKFSEGLAAVGLNGKTGFINTAGKVVIPCIYDFAWGDVRNGLIPVRLNGKSGFINTKGETVVPFVYDEIGYYPGDSYVLFDYDDVTPVLRDGKWGLINTKGKLIIPCINEYCCDDVWWDHVGGSVIARIVVNNRTGLYSSDKGWIVPCIYDRIDGFSGGLATVWLNEKQGCINVYGKIVVPCDYYGFDIERIYDGLQRVQSSDGKYGFVNAAGSFVIPCVYDYATSFSEGISYVKINGKEGCIDTKGELLVPCVYDDLRSLGKFFRVKMNGKYGLVKAGGDAITSCVYDDVYEFSEGFAAVKLNGKYGFVDTNGDLVIPCVYDYVASFSEGLASVRSDGWYGVINAKGEAVVPCMYYDVGSFRDGLAYASIGDGRKQIIDRSGHIIIGECETAYWARIDL